VIAWQPRAESYELDAVSAGTEVGVLPAGVALAVSAHPLWGRQMAAN